MGAFLIAVKELRHGGVEDDLDAHLADIVQAVRETGRPASLTFKLSVKPAAKGNGNTVVVDDAITIKRPEPVKESTIFFTNENNGLQRNDPRQPELTGLRVAGEVATFTKKEAAQS